MIIEEAIEVLKATYESLDVVALGLPVDAYEAAVALEDADPASVEYVCLQAIVRTHPVPVIVPDAEE